MGCCYFTLEATMNPDVVIDDLYRGDRIVLHLKDGRSAKVNFRGIEKLVSGSYAFEFIFCSGGTGWVYTNEIKWMKRLKRVVSD